MGLRKSSLVRVLVCVLGGVLVLLCAPFPGLTSQAQALGKGIVDYRLEWTEVNPSTVHALVQEIGPEQLGAKWTRILVHWNALEPNDNGTYAQWYVEQLDNIVGQLHTAGVNVILTPVDVPKWASDSSLWGTCKQPGVGSGYQPFYAMNVSDSHVLGRFQALGRYLASHFSGETRYLEVWNEPNLWSGIYPQNRHKGSMDGAKTYLKMLKVFYKGAHEGASNAVVIAGGTAPRGTGNDCSTAPQVFAKYLKAHGAIHSMNAYSHHPYTPNKTRQLAPGGMPNNPKRAVILGNLKQLTKLFPHKPFYLTEYGYNTQRCNYFGAAVSQVKQAQYLSKAYSYVRTHYKQVKALLWYEVDDCANAGSDGGVYTGVRSATGGRKLSWYAFAGHNKLSIVAPKRTKASRAFTISGKLTYRVPDPAVGQKLALQTRTSARKGWKTLKSLTSSTDGTYSFSVKQRAKHMYRVIWNGVCQSASRTVRTP